MPVRKILAAVLVACGFATGAPASRTETSRDSVATHPWPASWIAPDSSRTTRGVTDSMATLASDAQLRKVFASDSGRVRLVALLSPTCPGCRKGFAALQKTLADVRDPRLRAYVVWQPVLPEDDRAAARVSSAQIPDPRATCMWDPHRLTARTWKQVLHLQHAAWDVYLVYGPDSKWAAQPDPPRFWMHRLKGLTAAPFLDQARFEAEVRALLAPNP